MTNILITGSAGFIGSSLVLKLLNLGYSVLGIDNHNSYYDPKIKEDRVLRHLNHKNYEHIRGDISNSALIDQIFKKYCPSIVVNLAAQAGVRYSLENPLAYIESNVLGFANILEGCRHSNVEHLIYASSSSVYGANTQTPFSVRHSVDHPLSLYAASKKSNELMAHAYSHLYQLPTTALRFFTVYGPWGRPDMALFKFTKAILSGSPIQLYNHGRHSRDFTYIDDIVEGIVRVLFKPAAPNVRWDSKSPDPGSSAAPWRVYNIGRNKPVELLEYVRAIETATGEKANIELLPLQAGDVPDTDADVEDLVREFGYKPTTTVQHGVTEFIRWFRGYYKC